MMMMMMKKKDNRAKRTMKRERAMLSGLVVCDWKFGARIHTARG